MRNLISTLTSLAAFALVFSACSDEVVAPQTGGGSTGTSDTWLISQSEVFDGGPGKDGIPSVDRPRFVKASEIDYMGNDDLVLALSINGVTKGYTHPVLDWHEIVNDHIGGEDIAIIYCPLTGTGIGWNREINGVTTTFGVSGLLYRNNIIPYDRHTDSNWSQIRLECVQGQLRSTKPRNHPMVEMPLGLWKKMFPGADILSSETGFSRNYDVYPYGNYKTNHNNLLFPVGEIDSRLPAKERVLGVMIDGVSRVYRFTSFEGGLAVRHDSWQGENLVIVGSQPDNFMMAFRNLDDRQFTPLDIGPGGVVMADDRGNEFNIFGLAVSGPEAGLQLRSPDLCIGYWFSFGAFYDPEIFES